MDWTRKKAKVEPEPTKPYLIFVWLARSSTDEMGDSVRSTVRKAAKLAVYDEIIIIVKNHQMPATIRVDVALQSFHLYKDWNWRKMIKKWIFLLWSQIAALLHERTDCEPSAVLEIESILQFFRIGIARMWIDPFKRRQSIREIRKWSHHIQSKFNWLFTWPGWRGTRKYRRKRRTNKSKLRPTTVTGKRTNSAAVFEVSCTKYWSLPQITNAILSTSIKESQDFAIVYTGIHERQTEIDGLFPFVGDTQVSNT